MIATLARESVASAMRRGLARPEKLSGSAWAQRHRQIADKYAAQKGAWRNDRVPYLAEIMDVMADPNVRKVAVIKAEQVGGTEAMNNFVLRAVHQDPGPLLWLWPTDDVARVFCTERFTPTIKACRAVAGEFTERRQDLKTLQLSLGRMTIDFVGSNSPSAIESFPRRYVLVDELDRCPRYIVDQVIGRTTTYTGREKIILNGRPENEDEGIDEQYKLGDQREFMVPCPRCGVYHTRTWNGVKWEGSLDANPDVVAATAWFRCPNCDGTIHAHENMWQLRRGVWCPKGMTVTECDLASGEKGTLVGEKERGGAFPSFHIRGLLNPFVPNPYGFIAQEFVKNKGTATREWSTRRLGEAWSERGRQIKPGALQKLCIQIEEGGYRRGVCPADVQIIIAAADVQQDRVFCEFTGWRFNEGGLDDCWLLDHAELPRTEADGLKNLWPQMLRTFTRIGPGGEDKGQVPVSLAGVDSGHFTTEVYDAVRSKRGGRWDPAGTGSGPMVFPTKGQPGYARNDDYFWSRPEKNDRGRPIPGSVFLLNTNTHRLKTDLDEHLRAAESIRRVQLAEMLGRRVSDVDGEWIGREAALRFPEDTAHDYFEQLVAEELRKKLDRGRTVWRWTPKRQGEPNHYLDCRIIAMALSRWVRGKMIAETAGAKSVETKPPALSAERRAARAAVQDERWLRLRERTAQRRGGWAGGGEANGEPE